jgi:hypothetical protein
VAAALAVLEIRKTVVMLWPIPVVVVVAQPLLLAHQLTAGMEGLE